MPKQQLKTHLFGQNETLDDLTAEQEELNALPPAGFPERNPSEPVEPPVEAPSTEAPKAIPAPPSEPEAPPAQETRADKRIRELLENRAEFERRLAEAQRENAEYKERFARFDERRKVFHEAETAAQQQAQAAQRPDPSIDPMGAQLWDIQEQNKQLLAWKQQQEQSFAQLQQAFQGQQQVNQFDNYVVAAAQAYEREHPDYIPVAQHGANARVQWAVDEIGLTPDEARQIVQQEAQFWARVAASKGKSFPQAFYRFGQMMGYKVPAANGNGTAPTPQAASNAARVLNQVRQGQAMQGLSRAPSAGASNVSRYRDMTAAEVSSVSERQWQRDWANPALRPDMEYALRKLDGLSEDEDISYQGRG